MPRLLVFSALLLAQVSPQCGSSGSSSGATSPPNNMLSIVVNSGPTGDYLNGLFTSIVVCVPGTTNCQTIGGVLVDTGSEGLRILGTALTLSLPQRTTAAGAPLVECAQFVDGFTWGPLRTADVKLSGETASAIPIQVIGEGQYPIPQQCTSTGVAEDTLADLGANGVLGIGNFREDCGPSCVTVGSSNPGFYYGCPSSGCTVAAVPLTSQLQNPVWLFGSDNNGVMIQLPNVPLGGVATLNGTMFFGIGTQSNNGLGSAKVLTTDGAGDFTTIYNGQSYPESFIDSGSNGIFFLDSATAGIPLCRSSSDFYCPPRTLSLTATTRGANGVSVTVPFSVGNAEQLDGTLNAFSEIAGPNPGSFDWGLPFFFGRSVFIAIEGQSAPGGTAPYWAY